MGVTPARPAPIVRSLLAALLAGGVACAAAGVARADRPARVAEPAWRYTIVAGEGRARAARRGHHRRGLLGGILRRRRRRALRSRRGRRRRRRLARGGAEERLVVRARVHARLQAALSLRAGARRRRLAVGDSGAARRHVSGAAVDVAAPSAARQTGARLSLHGVDAAWLRRSPPACVAPVVMRSAPTSASSGTRRTPSSVPFPVEHMNVGGAEIELALLPASGRALAHPPLLKALSRAADVVARYFHRFPVPRLLVMIIPTEGDDLHGRTLGGGGASMMLYVGVDASPEMLDAQLGAGARTDAPGVPDGAAAAAMDCRGHGHVSRADRARAGRRPDRRKGVARSRRRAAAGRAGERRSRARPHRHLGAHLLGRRALLHGRRPADPRAHRQPPLARRRGARHRRRRRHARAHWPLSRRSPSATRRSACRC